MFTFKNIRKREIAKITTLLKQSEEVNCALPGGGLLHIEPGLPFLMVCRRSVSEDPIARVVINQASYLLIADVKFKKYKKLILAISDVLSSIYKSYLILELYCSKTSQLFRIKGPEDKLPSFLKALKLELNKLSEQNSLPLTATQIENTTKRQPEGTESLMTTDKAKQCGALLVGLEIPAVFYDKQGSFYPVFFREFRDSLVKSIHKAIYEYIRVQTTCGIQSYRALGRSSLKHKVFEIDQKLTSIEESYKFLWLISPSNIYTIKKEFFESKYHKVIPYHYRLLPIDPDILKRALYNLKIEEIDDPSMSHLFRQKREELDLQISMLNTRGTTKFYHNSIRLYGEVDNNLFQTATLILSELDQEIEQDLDQKITALEFSTYARKEFEFFKSQHPEFKSKIHIRKDVNIMMVNQGELYIPADYTAQELEAKALIQHELGTHVLTYFNGSQQPLTQLSTGLSDYDILQEGVAVMSEFFSGCLSVNRLRTLAGRVVAGKALLEGGNFNTIFQLLFDHHGFSQEHAFNITSRIMQGGGFLKDIIYLKGLIELREYLMDGGDYELLFAGKFGFNHIHIIEELIERNVLVKGLIKPSYVFDQMYEERLQQIKNGMPIHQMARRLVSTSNHT